MLEAAPVPCWAFRIARRDGKFFSVIGLFREPPVSRRLVFC